ncbi:uncharacterized protein CTRU02_215726 [Colletotrichum truncatum]|uniref:Uncharacterized protein n=1 Tax=Colletotrichum truncatum TaxID=5467 RepID=A0ACC3YC16_COLTU|nr:uncharacterized protein CTRU02_14939 [Colletotrichum truncatum]KAF6781641.1 hypothetical protein CTRU02_14939 [Colletotrichum truncatum]
MTDHNMPSRRTHSKSRHGCSQCKARKVKCGEERPSCSRCRKRRVHCSYDDVPRLASPLPTVASPDDAPGLGVLEVNGRANVSQSPPVGSLVHLQAGSSGQPLTSFFREDFELLHHYSTVTYQTILDDESTERAWRVNVPQEGARHDFLMHGILAVAAMHLRRLRPESAAYYNHLATQHYSESLKLYRPILDQLSRSTATPVFIFSSFLVCMSLQMFEQNDQQDLEAVLSLDSILDAFKLERGIHDILRLTWDWLLGTPFSSLLLFSERMTDCLITLDDNEALDRVEACVREDLTANPMLGDYLDAVKRLREVYACRSTAIRHKSAVFSWPVLVSTAFYDEMTQKKPLAIVLLAYFGLLLNELRNVWWVGRAGRRLLRDCADLLSGKHRELVGWAERRVDANMLRPVGHGRQHDPAWIPAANAGHM